VQRELLCLFPINIPQIVDDLFETSPVLAYTPSVGKYKTFRGTNPKIPEIRKNSIIFSSTQPKEEFPCTFCVGFPESARKQDFHLDDAKRSREKNS